MMVTVLIIVFFISLFLGLPVFLTMCIAAICAFIENGNIAMTMLPQHIFAGINSFPVMAIPLFIMASDLMTEGKLTDMLIKFCNDYLGRITGGLGHVNVALSMIFGGIPNLHRKLFRNSVKQPNQQLLSG
jgi:TRAP-type mannitol/chloroaromatic compound transport system permease large subunit